MSKCLSSFPHTVCVFHCCLSPSLPETKPNTKTKGKLDDKLANRKNEPEANLEDRYTAPIREVLDRYNVPKTIDYMSLDVEGSEYEIMKDFPFDGYRIQVMTIERPSKQLKELLESKGYILLKRLAWWGETLWAHSSTGFTPDHPKIAKIVTEERHR